MLPLTSVSLTPILRDGAAFAKSVASGGLEGQAAHAAAAVKARPQCQHPRMAAVLPGPRNARKLTLIKAPLSPNNDIANHM